MKEEFSSLPHQHRASGRCSSQKSILPLVTLWLYQEAFQFVDAKLSPQQLHIHNTLSLADCGHIG